MSHSRCAFVYFLTPFLPIMFFAWLYGVDIFARGVLPATIWLVAFFSGVRLAVEGWDDGNIETEASGKDK